MSQSEEAQLETAFESRCQEGLKEPKLSEIEYHLLHPKFLQQHCTLCPSILPSTKLFRRLWKYRLAHLLEQKFWRGKSETVINFKTNKSYLNHGFRRYSRKYIDTKIPKSYSLSWYLCQKRASIWVPGARSQQGWRLYILPLPLNPRNDWYWNLSRY